MPSAAPLVLAAAQRAFAEHGPSVSLAEVARRAGSARAPLLPALPTKVDLLEAVMHSGSTGWRVWPPTI